MYIPIYVVFAHIRTYRYACISLAVSIYTSCHMYVRFERPPRRHRSRSRMAMAYDRCIAWLCDTDDPTPEERASCAAGIAAQWGPPLAAPLEWGRRWGGRTATQPTTVQPPALSNATNSTATYYDYNYDYDYDYDNDYDYDYDYYYDYYYYYYVLLLLLLLPRTTITYYYHHYF
jgi:hypothetical protein